MWLLLHGTVWFERFWWNYVKSSSLHIWVHSKRNIWVWLWIKNHQNTKVNAYQTKNMHSKSNLKLTRACENVLLHGCLHLLSCNSHAQHHLRGRAAPAPGAPRRCLGFGPWWQHASCPPRARLRCARAGRLTACTATSCTTCPGALSVKRCGGIPTCTATSCTKCPRWNIWNATTPIVVKRSLSGFQQKPGAQVDDHPVGQPEWCWVDELSMDQTWSNPWGEHSRLAKIYGCSSSPNIW